MNKYLIPVLCILAVAFMLYFIAIALGASSYLIGSTLALIVGKTLGAFVLGFFVYTGVLVASRVFGPVKLFEKEE